MSDGDRQDSRHQDSGRSVEKRRTDSASVHATVDRIVLLHGAYRPLELLLDQGRLQYADYEAWRTGAEPCLDGVLRGNPARITAMLETADDWARRLGLAAEVEPQEGWGPNAGRRVDCARDPRLNALLSTVYRRRADNVQPDLFLDGSDTVLLADLRAALSTRDADNAGRCLDELLRRMPEHRLRPAAERLCDALSHLGEAAAPVDSELELERLQGQLAVDARELLGTSARDFEVPFWRRLAEALEGRRFDSGAPLLHASYAFGRCLAWGEVIECVLAASGFEHEPVLLIRLVEAGLNSNDRPAAVRWLAALCWNCPEAAETFLDANALRDRSAASAWEAFRNFDAEPIMNAAWFPAWLLLTDPGLARAVDVAPSAAGSPAVDAFLILGRMLAQRDTGPDDIAISLRQQLRDVHPALLAHYLQRYGQQPNAR